MKRSLIYLILIIFAAGCHMDIPQKPVADFIYNPTAGCQAPCNVTFTSTSENADGFVWDFDDGSPVETGASVVHEFPNGKDYYVKLIARGTDGGSHGTTKMVRITTAPSAVPVAEFTYTITSDSIAPATVSFNNQSKDANRYKWDFGDPASTTTNPNESTEQNPSHTFVNGGKYPVTLTAYNGDKPSTPVTVYIIVKQSVTSTHAFSISGDDNYPTDILTDVSGNIYVSGAFSGTVSFGNGNNATSRGGTDFFVAKYNANWQCLWVYKDGSGGDDHINDIVLDNLGNVYATGHVAGAILGTGVTPRGGVSDGFVVKLNPFTGARQWISTFGGPKEDRGRSLAFYQPATGDARIYLAATVVGDGKTSNIEFNETKYIANEKDFCLATINPTNGQISQSVLVTGTGTQTVEALIADPNGNIYLTGGFDTGFSFPSVKPAITLLGASDAYIAKWASANQQFEWVKPIASVNDDFGLDLTLDMQNNVYATGMSKGYIQEINVNSLGDFNVYVGKWSPTGNALIGKNGFNNGTPDFTGGIAFSTRGTLLLSGSYSETGRFPFSSNDVVTSAGNTDMIFTELDPNDLNPTRNFFKSGGGTGEDRAVKICTAPDNYVYSTGRFAGSALYNTVTLRSTATATGAFNTYIVRYKL